MQYSPDQVAQALVYIEPARKQQVYAIVNSVSRSGMSRRIEFYYVDENREIIRIGKYIAVIIGAPYSLDKGGVLRSGCGMDMIYDTLSALNTEMWVRDRGEPGDNSGFGDPAIYGQYFINASYRSL